MQNKKANPKTYAQRTLKKRVPFICIIFWWSKVFEYLAVNKNKSQAISGKDKVKHKTSIKLL